MRVNFYAGPGAGKSTASEGISYLLKRKGHNVELIREFIKDWAYMGRPIKSFDRVHFFGEQIHREDLMLQCGVQTIVTDSPLLLIPAYGKLQGWHSWKPLLDITLAFEERHPAVHILLERGNLPYKTLGRYENYQQALEVDAFIRDFMVNDAKVPVLSVDTQDHNAILDYVEKAIQSEKRN
jgi:hypothetical protein